MNTENTNRNVARINGLAVASLVLGVLWLMWVGSILALVFGYVAKGQIDRSPHSEGGRGLAVAGIVLGWVGVGSLAFMATMVMTGVLTMPDMPMMNRTGIGDDFSSNGERIYMTAVNDSGETITYQEGPGDGMMSGALACIDCHGTNGRGGERQMMMETFYAPDIRWSTLTGDHTGNEDDNADQHGPYTRETVRAAITQGIGSGGRPLDTVMPRWQLTPEDLSDLIDYLQTLDDSR
jgi:mono/diheme cytochrome c family protein